MVHTIKSFSPKKKGEWPSKKAKGSTGKKRELLRFSKKKKNTAIRGGKPDLQVFWGWVEKTQKRERVGFS